MGKKRKSREAAGEGKVKADLLKDGRVMIVLEELAFLYTQSHMMPSVPESWKNANIFLLYKKGDDKDFKN